jgi:ubiquinone/menaquinone biosynthesis C-methylase UbiE
MTATTYIVLGLITLGLLITFTWRLSSRRHTLPCPVWLRWLVELDNPFTKTNRAAVIIEHLRLQPGMTVLDAGCGPGRLTLPLARGIGNQGKVVAMDIQQGMLRRTREKAEASNLTNIEYLEAGIGEGRLEADRFDVALLVTVLGEIPDRETALEEIYRSLKHGGLLSITEIIFDPHFQPRGTITRLATDAGFKEKAFYGNRIAYTLHLEKPANG